MATERVGAAKLMKYFGKLPGQTIQGFKKELDELTDEDFSELVSLIPNNSK